MEISKDTLLNAYNESTSKRHLCDLLRTSSYYIAKYEKQYNLKFTWKVTSPYTIEYWVRRGYTIDEAKYNIAIRRSYNIMYWTHKFGETVGKQKYYEFITKGSKGKTASYETRCKNKRCIEYWVVTQGLSEEEGKNKLKQFQNNTSLDKYIYRYGEVDGTEKFNDRQFRWQSTLNKKSDSEKARINELKKSNSIDTIIKQYGNDWMSVYLTRNFYKDGVFKDIVLKAIQYNNIDDVIENITDISPKYIHLYRFLKNTLIQYIFNVNVDNIDIIHSKMMLKYGISDYKKHKYGSMIEYDGTVYQSKGEYEIAKFLSMNNVDFLYDKKYADDTNFRYDFYLTKYDYYIEYAGLTGKKHYDYRIEEKRQYCLNKNINVLISNDIQFIIDNIKKLL
jgi:hypothetical protein